MDFTINTLFLTVHFTVRFHNFEPWMQDFQNNFDKGSHFVQDNNSPYVLLACALCFVIPVQLMLYA